MTREEFSVLVKGMKAIYSDAKFIPDKDAFDVWYGFLGHLDYAVANAAINRHVVSSKFPPTIRDILENTSGGGETEADAWAMVRKAIRNGIYGSEKEFAKLPESVQKAVGSHESLSTWAMLPSDEIETVIQSHFLRVYRTVREREKTDQLIAPLLGRREAERITG